MGKKEISAQVVLAAIQKDAKPTINKLKDLCDNGIKDQKDFISAGKLMKELKVWRNTAQDQKKFFTSRLTELLNGIRTLFRPFENQVDQIETEIKTLMLVWDEKIEANKKKLAAQYEDDKPVKPGLLVDNSSPFSQSKSIDEFIYTIKDIPVMYLLPNVVKIKQAIKDGKSIPGVEVKKKKIIAI